MESIKYITKRLNIELKLSKVKAHVGEEGNELADRLIKEGRRENKIVIKNILKDSIVIDINWYGIPIEKDVKTFMGRIKQII